MIRIARIVLVLFIVLMVVENADARRRLFRRRSYKTTTYSKNLGVEWNGKVAIREDDQAACQKEANYMASRYIRGHVWGRIGVFEGCGWGVWRGSCATCRPTWGATLTGDATAVSASGEKFRVRSWR
jgi:hypothetical protein